MGVFLKSPSKMAFPHVMLSRALAVSIASLFAGWMSAVAPEVRGDEPSVFSLWYDAPATRWVEALPLGNGRLGAMDFGGIRRARYQFNEDTLWAGQPHSYAHEGAAAVLPQLRQLLLDGKQDAA